MVTSRRPWGLFATKSKTRTATTMSTTNLQHQHHHQEKKMMMNHRFTSTATTSTASTASAASKKTLVKSQQHATPTTTTPTTPPPTTTFTRRPIQTWNLSMTCIQLYLLFRKNDPTTTSFNEVFGLLVSFICVCGLTIDKCLLRRSNSNSNSNSNSTVIIDDDRRRSIIIMEQQQQRDNNNKTRRQQKRKGRTTTTIHYRFFSILTVIFVQIMLLFMVNSIIVCSDKAQSDINILAWKFLWVSQEQKEKVFGSTLQTQYIIQFLQPIFFQSLLTSIILGILITYLPLHYYRGCGRRRGPPKGELTTTTNTTTTTTSNRCNCCCDNTCAWIVPTLLRTLIMGTLLLSMLGLVRIMIMTTTIGGSNSNSSSLRVGFLSSAGSGATSGATSGTGTGTGTADFCQNSHKPPFIPLKNKPNIVVLTIDSWRRDLVDETTMPNTLRALGLLGSSSDDKEDGDGDKTNDTKKIKAIEWKYHDSCSVNSDQGYATLYYSKLGLTDVQLVQHTTNPNITSWNIDVFKQNEYTTHKVIPYVYDFCWMTMELCDWLIRDYDTINKEADPSLNTGNRKDRLPVEVRKHVVFNNILDLFRNQSTNGGGEGTGIGRDGDGGGSSRLRNKQTQQQQQNQELELLLSPASLSSQNLQKQQQNHHRTTRPMFISADLQDIHHPYRNDGTIDNNKKKKSNNDNNNNNIQNNNNLKYHTPTLTRDELDKLHSKVHRMNEKSIQEAKIKLRNRYRNSLLSLDVHLGKFLEELKPYMNNTILILTGDHGEFIMEDNPLRFTHGQESLHPIQRSVPLYMWGPRDIISALEIDFTTTGTTTTTCHTDVLPSLIEALHGSKFEDGSRWKQEIFMHSYYNHGGGTKTSATTSSSAISNTGHTTDGGFAFARFHNMMVLQHGSLVYEQKNAHHARSTGGTYYSTKRGIQGRGSSVDDEQQQQQSLSDDEKLQLQQLLQKYSNHEWPGWNTHNCGGGDADGVNSSNGSSENSGGGNNTTSSWLFEVDDVGKVQKHHKRRPEKSLPSYPKAVSANTNTNTVVA